MRPWQGSCPQTQTPTPTEDGPPSAPLQNRCCWQMSLGLCPGEAMSSLKTPLTCKVLVMIYLWSSYLSLGLQGSCPAGTLGIQPWFLQMKWFLGCVQRLLPERRI